MKLMVLKNHVFLLRSSQDNIKHTPKTSKVQLFGLFSKRKIYTKQKNSTPVLLLTSWRIST